MGRMHNFLRGLDAHIEREQEDEPPMYDDADGPAGFYDAGQRADEPTPPTCDKCGALLSEVEAAGRASGKCNECLRDKNEYPRVGDAATIGYWSDRHAATVIYVSPSFKTIRVQRDTATLVGGSIMGESQEYTYAPNPYGTITTARRHRRTDGKPYYTGSGGSPRVYVGHRDEHRDPHF